MNIMTASAFRTTKAFIRHILCVVFITVSIFSVGAINPTEAFSAGVEHSVIVKLRTSETLVLQALAREVEPLFGWSTNKAFQNIYRIQTTRTPAQLRNILRSSAEYIEAEGLVETDALTVTDPWFTPDPANINKQWGLVKAGFASAWEKSQGSVTTVVAVIDTGIDASHVDLQQVNYVPGYDFVLGKELAKSTSTDPNGHGTLVAGIIAATPNNGIGIAGAAWSVSLMPVLALDEEGIGTSADVAEAIVWAADHGAHIINLSLSDINTGHDTTLSNAISYAFRKNVVIVAAAGNDSVTAGQNLDSRPLFPVCDDNGENMVIGVVAVDHRDTKPDFSNYGKTCVDVSAPGKRIISTVNHDPFSGAPAPHAYAYASGTSMAVPFVVAQAALLKSSFPGATNTQIRDRIITTSDNIDALNLTQCSGSCMGLLGAGRINAGRSLEQPLRNQLVEGDLVQLPSGEVYYINGGRRQLVSPFVRQQRFAGRTPKQASAQDLAVYPEGTFAEPLDGTLIKSQNNPTVYYMSKGVKQPITGQVFAMHGFSFANVFIVSDDQLDSWISGSFYSPPEGTLLKSPLSPTVYWVVGGSLHPINYEFYVNRGLAVFPILVMSSEDIKSFATGEAFVL